MNENEEKIKNQGGEGRGGESLTLANGCFAANFLSKETDLIRTYRRAGE